MTRATDAIAGVIQIYFDGLHQGSTRELARAFHPCARLYSLDAGAVREVSRADWFAAVEARPAPAASALRRTDRIVSIDVTDDVVAVAKVECSIHPRYFVDYLTLLKTESAGWQIVSKAFRTEMRES